MDYFPPRGCKPSKICTFTANQDGQRYKISTCLVKNPGLTSPKGDEELRLAQVAVNETETFKLSNKDAKTLHNNGGFQVDRESR